MQEGCEVFTKKVGTKLLDSGENKVYNEGQKTKARKIMKTNYHTHTVRCNHAKGTDREYVEAAIEKGVEELGFSDHSPYIFKDGHTSSFRMSLAAYDDYFASLSALREEFKDQITLYIGLEMEYYRDDFDATLAFVKKHPIDYLILGQHFIDGEPGCAANTAGSDDEGRLVKYVDRVIEAMGRGVYSYVAHPDVLNFTGDEEIYRREVRRLCKASLETETPLEINLLGIRDLRRYPNPVFWEEAGKLGCHVILGCDAHGPRTVSDDVSAAKAEEMIEKYGLIREEKLRFKLK